MFKGVLEDGTRFSVESGMVLLADKQRQEKIQLRANLNYGGYFPSPSSMDNHIGHSIISDYGGKALSEADVSGEYEFDPDVFY